jgi:hypothetical protein
MFNNTHQCPVWCYRRLIDFYRLPPDNLPPIIFIVCIPCSSVILINREPFREIYEMPLLTLVLYYLSLYYPFRDKTWVLYVIEIRTLQLYTLDLKLNFLLFLYSATKYCGWGNQWWLGVERRTRFQFVVQSRRKTSTTYPMETRRWYQHTAQEWSRRAKER